MNWPHLFHKPETKLKSLILKSQFSFQILVLGYKQTPNSIDREVTSKRQMYTIMLEA